MKIELIGLTNQIGIIYGNIGKGNTKEGKYIIIFKVLYNTYMTLHKNIGS